MQGNRYRVLVTPTSPTVANPLADITVSLKSGAVTDAAGNGNASASNTLTVVDNTPIDITSNLGWKEVLTGSQFDYYDDTQARADGVDLVGNASNPLLYTQYNVATNEVAFRLRMESATAKGAFYLLGIAGNPAGNTLDFFVGVFVPTNGSPVVRFYAVSYTHVTLPTNRVV